MPIYSETQRPRQSWLILLIAVLTLCGWGLFLQQIVRGKPFGDNPLPDWGAILASVLLGLVLPAFFLWFRVETTVYSDRVDIRMTPFSHRVVRLSELASATARTYRPMREFGGWGLRGWGANKAFDGSIDPETVQIVVIGPNGGRADTGVSETTAGGARATAVQPGFSDGRYLVSWLVAESGSRASAFGDLGFTLEGPAPCQPASNATLRLPAVDCLADPVTGAPDEPISSNGMSV